VHIYATMNPASIGGGRNQLPRSLRSLFTAVQLQRPSGDEVRSMAFDMFFPCLEHQLLEVEHVQRLLTFHQAATTAAERRDIGHSSGGTEFNLRDLIKVRGLGVMMAAATGC